MTGSVISAATDWIFWLLVATEKVILRVECYATVIFLVWFWEKAIRCDGYGDG